MERSRGNCPGETEGLNLQRINLTSRRVKSPEWVPDCSGAHFGKLISYQSV